MSAVAQLKPIESTATQSAMSLIDQVRAEMVSAGLTQKDVARQAGVSGTTLSQWMQRKYRGNDDAISEQMQQWLASRAARKASKSALPSAPCYLETPTSRKIITHLRFAQVAGDLAVIYGSAGTGKSTTLWRYAETAPNVWVVAMAPDCSGVVPTLEEVAFALGMRDLPGGAARLRRDVVARVTGTEGLLIVDEAQHLSVASLEELRTIHDRTGVGLVLVGNETVYGRLTGGKRAEHFAQLFSRIGKRLHLCGPTKADALAIIDHYGIRDPEARASLCRIADEPGGLRGLVKTARLALMFAGGDAVAREHVMSAWKDLGGVK